MSTRYWVGGSSTWDSTSTTNWASSSGGSSGASAPTVADTVVFDNNSDAGANFTVTVGTGAACLDFTFGTGGSALDHVMTLSGSGDLRVGGDFTLVSSNLTFSFTGSLNFQLNSATNTITTASKTLGCAITFNGTSSSWTLQDNFVSTASPGITFTAGTIDLNNFNLTCPIFSSSNTNTRVLAFGTGVLYLTKGNTAGTILAMQDATNFSYTGTPVVNFTYASSAGTRQIAFGTSAGGTEANALSIKISAGNDSVTFNNNSKFLDVDFTGFSGTFNSNKFTSYGSVTISSGMTSASSSNVMTMAATSGTKNLTTNGKTINQPITFDGTGGTFSLADALTCAKTVTLTSGTFTANNKNLSILSFSSSGTGTRTLTIGSGTWTVTGSGTVWDCTTVTNLTVSASAGTLSFNSSSAKAFIGGGKTWPTINQAGSGALTISGSNTFTDITNTVQPTTVTFTSGTTQTFTTDFSLSGTSGNLVTINASTTSQATLTKSSGTLSVSYCDISYSNAIGGASWQAYVSDGNINDGNNTGWLFSPAGTGNFFMVLSA